MYFKGTYSNGCVGCDETEYFKANNIEEVLTYMDEGLWDYAESYAHVHFGWNNEYTEEDFEDYYEGCDHTVTEITDMEELEGEDIIDLTD